MFETDQPIRESKDRQDRDNQDGAAILPSRGRVMTVATGR